MWANVTIDFMGEPVDLDVEFGYVAPDFGCNYGHPDNHYPSEPESWLFYKVELNGNNVTPVLLFPNIEAAIIDEIKGAV